MKVQHDMGQLKLLPTIINQVDKNQKVFKRFNGIYHKLGQADTQRTLY